MMTTCLLAAALALAPDPEAALESKLPEIFAKSAAHYRALDAAATPLMKGAKGELRTPHSLKSGALDMRSIIWWTSGHFPGSLWYLYEATDDDFFRDRATVWTETLAPNAKVTDNHDVGFIMYCSYGNARRLLKTDKYDKLLVETANSLCQRYNAKLGLIRSWGDKDDQKSFLVIPDNLMNLELLEFAAGKEKVEVQGRGRQWNFDQIARSHADVTMRHHFREDGGVRHVLNYDQHTCRVKEIRRGQGASAETAWSRGESWAIYGYTMMYREEGLLRYLDFAKKLADYAINHPNMPEDGIPYWDYGVTGEERDSSAAAIMASALLELSQYVGAADRDRYRQFAVKQLLTLASPAYFSEGDEIGHWLLKHGTGNKPDNSEIDVPLDYGDYYFLEALLRFRNLKARERAVAARFEASGCAEQGIQVLSEKAQLPADEFLLRSRVAETNALDVAKAAVKNPIPDTADELYGEFWTTGNRTHYEKRFFSRMKNLDALVYVLAYEKPDAPSRRKYLERLEDYLAAICEMKSWILPAHDWAEGGKGTWRGEWMSADLFGTELAAHVGLAVQFVGRELKRETIARVKAEAERRIFGPIRREAPARLFEELAIGEVRVRNHWWVTTGMNWNAVCWDNLACAAMGLLEDRSDRAFFAAAADKAADSYIAGGFADDGYCSEGMGYWNYGFGHHLMTGRMLDRLTQGKFNFFRRPKQRLAAAYARAYTLCEGASPAFADGNGAASPVFLGIVDEFWPDLPKALPPASEFPVGQVWLFRDPEGLSVAFKGGHNDELHNHNDIGSYYIVADRQFVAGDPGGEEYTRRTFSAQRYESKVLNSYGHPVPVVGGKLQGTGRKYAAKVLEKKFEVEGRGRQRSVVVLDLTGAYEVKALKKLTRTFVYDRAAKAFTITDHVEFTEPTAFEDCYVTLGGSPGVKAKAKGEGEGGEVKAKESEETIENPHRKTPHRFAWTFEKPVIEAEVTFEFHSDAP